jgi:hypothetical protein
MPTVDVSTWTTAQIEDAADTVRARGVEPTITTIMRWPSAAELAHQQRQRADDVRLAQLRAQGLKGANRVRIQR